VKPDEQERMEAHVRGQLINAGMVDSRIAPGPLTMTARYIYSSSQAMGPTTIGHVYQAMAWALSHYVDDDVRAQAQRYLDAAYGKEWHFRAPEAFDNALERWIVYLALGSREMAADTISRIEKLAAQQKESRSNEDESPSP
jgi:hypothetical protein